MSVIVPVPVGGSAAGWSLVDYRTVRGNTSPAAGGTAQLTLEQLAGNELWLIDHAVVSCTSSTATSVRWYESSVDPLSLLDGTSSGDFDVADWPVGLLIQPSQSLVVVWSGASDGAIGTLRAQVRILRRQ